MEHGAVFPGKTVACQVTVMALAFATGWWWGGSAGENVPPAPPRAAGANSTPAASLAPASAAALAQAKADLARAFHAPGRINSDRLMLDCVEKLDRDTTKALLADLATKPLTDENSMVLSYLAYHWAEADPAGALAWLQGLHDANVRNACAGAIFDAYAAQDPSAALTALAKLPGGFNSAQLAVSTFSNFAQQDPRAALAALQMPANYEKFSGVTFVIFTTWAQSDPAAAAVEALKIPDSFLQSRSLQNVATAWAQQDPAAAMAWANTLPNGPLRDIAEQGIYQILGRDDPAGAADYAVHLPGGSSRDELINNITSNWAQLDPTALLAWADQNLTGQYYNTAVLAALEHISDTAPASVADYLGQNPDPNISKKAVPALATAWAQQDPQAALAWAQSLPVDNPALRDSAINAALTGWVATNPSVTAAYIQQNFAADPSFATLASRIVTTWADSDPQAALQWAKNLPPNAQSRATITALTQLAKVDPQLAGPAAREALNSLTGLTKAQQTNLQKIATAASNP